MTKADFVRHLGEENFCPSMDAAISRARELTEATFQFMAKPGQTLPQAEITVPLAEVASIWFENPASIPFGSQFVYRRSFTEESGVNAIASISVTLSNSLGISNPVGISF